MRRASPGDILRAQRLRINGASGSGCSVMPREPSCVLPQSRHRHNHGSASIPLPNAGTPPSKLGASKQGASRDRSSSAGTPKANPPLNRTCLSNLTARSVSGDRKGGSPRSPAVVRSTSQTTNSGLRSFSNGSRCRKTEAAPAGVATALRASLRSTSSDRKTEPATPGALRVSLRSASSDRKTDLATPGVATALRVNVRSASSDGRVAATSNYSHSEGTAWAGSTAEATTGKRTVLNTPEMLDDGRLSIHEPVDASSIADYAFHRKANEIRRELQAFCSADLGHLLRIHVPQKDQESKFRSTHQQKPQTKGVNGASSIDQQMWEQMWACGACTGTHGHQQTHESSAVIWTRVSV